MLPIRDNAYKPQAVYIPCTIDELLAIVDIFQPVSYSIQHSLNRPTGVLVPISINAVSRESGITVVECAYKESDMAVLEASRDASKAEL